MRQLLVLVFLSFCGCATSPQGSSANGPLVIVGGGGTPTSVVKKAIELAGGSKAIVAVLPQASKRKSRGQKSKEMFLAEGAQTAFVVHDLNSPEAKNKIQAATLIWMPGGSQNRLMESIRNAGLGATLLELHTQGVVFGGTSAGAAVQSQLMITGDAELRAILPETTKLAPGLGLITGAIIDQHAIKRRRFNRLLSAVLDHPQRIGIAIDEKTAVIFRNESFEVMGESTVLVIDARNSLPMAPESQKPHGARNIMLHVLRPGMSYEFENQGR